MPFRSPISAMSNSKNNPPKKNLKNESDTGPTAPLSLTTMISLKDHVKTPKKTMRKPFVCSLIGFIYPLCTWFLHHLRFCALTPRAFVYFKFVISILYFIYENFVQSNFHSHPESFVYIKKPQAF